MGKIIKDYTDVAVGRINGEAHILTGFSERKLWAFRWDKKKVAVKQQGDRINKVTVRQVSTVHKLHT